VFDIIESNIVDESREIMNNLGANLVKCHLVSQLYCLTRSLPSWA
jgi:hypothetical protein